jgi:hypothetical protein
MSAPLAVWLDDTIFAWLPYAALIVGGSVLGPLCSQLKFTRSVKFNYELIMINNEHSCLSKTLYSDLQVTFTTWNNLLSLY